MCGGVFEHATVKDVEQISYEVSFFKFYCFDTLFLYTGWLPKSGLHCIESSVHISPLKSQELQLFG